MNRLKETLVRYFVVLAIFLLTATSAFALEKSFDQGLDEIAQKITNSIPEGSRKTVAVIDFNSIEGNITVLGRFIEEELITRLFETGRFKVIERSLLEKAIEELKFNTSDLIDPTIAKQVGKVVGADAIVTGTLTDLGQSMKVNARVIMVESGEVIGAAGAQIVNDSAIREMLKKPLNSSFSTGSGASVKLSPISTTNIALSNLDAVMTADGCYKDDCVMSGPQYANDGNMSTFWNSDAPNNKNNWWIKADLGSNKLVGAVNIESMATYVPKDFTVQTSVDDVSYTIVATVTGNTATSKAVSFPLTTARYVRLNITLGNIYRPVIYEYQIKGVKK